MAASELNIQYNGSGLPVNDGPGSQVPRHQAEPPADWDCWDTCYLYELYGSLCSQRESENCLATGNPNHDRAGA